MAVCNYCGLEMKDAESCTIALIEMGNAIHKRDTSYFDSFNKRCHDCGIVNKAGNIHHHGCDMERCPICQGQLISCDCDNQKESEG